MRVTPLIACLLTGFVTGNPLHAAKPDEAAVAKAQPTVAKPYSPFIPRQRWMKQHNRYKALATKKKFDLVFLGDSITAGWTKHPAVFKKHFSKYRAVQFGIPGDRTENLLWRVRNGNLDKLSPKVFVVLIGVNNTAGKKLGIQCTSAQIGDGVDAVVEALRETCPGSKILLLGLLPVGDTQSESYPVPEVQRRAAALADGKHIFHVDIGTAFLNSDGTRNDALYKDHVHLSEAGYEAWGRALAPTLEKLLRKDSPQANK